MKELLSSRIKNLLSSNVKRIASSETELTGEAVSIAKVIVSNEKDLNTFLAFASTIIIKDKELYIEDNKLNLYDMQDLILDFSCISAIVKETLLSNVKRIASLETELTGEAVSVAKAIVNNEKDLNTFLVFASKIILEDYDLYFGDGKINLLDMQDLILDFSCIANIRVKKTPKSVTMHLVYSYDGVNGKTKDFITNSRLAAVGLLETWRAGQQERGKNPYGYFTFNQEDRKYYYRDSQVEHECFDNGRISYGEYLRWCAMSYEEDSEDFNFKVD